MAALPVALANYFTNVAARGSSTPPLGAWSSVCLTLRASERAAPYPVRFTREAALARAGLAAAQSTLAPSEIRKCRSACPCRPAAYGRKTKPDWPRIWRAIASLPQCLAAGTTSPNTAASTRPERDWSCSSREN